MPRETLVTGDIWTEGIANAVSAPRIDGENEYGSIDLVRDENMSPDPDQLKSRTYSYLDRLQLTLGLGRSLTYSQSFYLTNTGSLILIPAGEIVIPASVTGFVFVTGSGNVQFSNTLPSEGEPLALVASDVNSIIAFSDLREQAIARSKVLRIPEVRSAFSPGDIKITFSQFVDPGWLRCDGSYVDPIVQPNLFAAIGYNYGQQGNLFRLPNPNDRFLMAVTQANIGNIGGSNEVSLNTNQLPKHTHPLFQQPHDHYVKDEKHSHELIDYGHSHVVEDPGHDHRALNQRETNTFFDYLPGGGSEISKKGTGQFMPVASSQTGVQVQPNKTGIFMKAARGTGEIQRSSINIRVEPSGNNAPINVQNKFIGVGILIKT